MPDARATPETDATERWELYRLLADPLRMRLLALTAVEELGVGELAELLGEGQPKISRHASALREASLLAARRHGTWTLLRLAPGVDGDPVVADALGAGRSACERDGSLARIDDVVHRRDADTREFFARGGRPANLGPPAELAAYLAALAPLIPARHLAIDAGTGDGALLEVLSPVFDHVLAIDRSHAQLGLASERVSRRGFKNVELLCGELDGPELASALERVGSGGADVVFAARVLHHAPKPALAVQHLAALARKPSAGTHAGSGMQGGSVLIVDYAEHHDQALRDQQADLWLGFSKAELRVFAEEAGLIDIQVHSLPASFKGDGPDRHIGWLALHGRVGESSHAPHTRKS